MQRRRRIRSHTGIACMLARVANAGDASAAGVDAVLAQAATAVEIESFVGTKVTRSVAAPHAMSLCEWQFGDRAV